jgi:hypothetical protein
VNKMRAVNDARAAWRREKEEKRVREREMARAGLGEGEGGDGEEGGGKVGLSFGLEMGGEGEFGPLGGLDGPGAMGMEERGQVALVV